MSKETKEMHPEGREVVDRRAFLKMVAGAAAGAGVVAGMPEIAAAQTSKSPVDWMGSPADDPEC
ncbi:MAG TPA: twin-arginine translocation signal domain-containing protein [Nitrospira sp.]|nr:twin-arginine translocation signal domain-containing protein [Nitrospira sp.]